MKETKLLARESKNEEEKSKLEVIEEELKSSIFSVFYLLLKNQETTFWKFIVLLVIEYLQLLSYSFDTSVMKEWKTDNVVQYFAQFLSSFRVVYWIRQLDWDVYLIIFYICIFLVFAVLLDFLYVAISFKHKRFSFMQPIQALRIACILIVTIFYIPITELFFTISACQQDPDDSASKALKNVFYTEEICFQSIHILHAILSYIMFLVFGGIALLITLMDYETRYTKDPTSRINAKSDLFMLLQKTIYLFFFTFFSQEGYAIFKSMLLCVFSTITFLSFVSNKPYFNYTTQMLVQMFAGIFVWTNYVLLFVQIIASTEFNGSLQILFLGIPIICILIYTRKEDRLGLLLTSEIQIQKGYYCQKKNYFYMHIIESREQDRYSSIILKGYINHHCQQCPIENCPIKTFRKMMLKEKLGGERERKKKAASQSKNFQHNENNALLLAQAKALYINGIHKFPKYIQLRIDYASFLQSKMKDRKGALAELAQAEKLKPSLDQQFMIYRQRKIIEDELSESQEHGGIDFIAAMNFENQFKLFKQLIEKSALLHYEFWNHLLDDSPDLVRLSQQGAKINASILSVEDHWKKLSKMSTNTPKALKLYASYLIEILNDKETGNEQMIKAKEAANLRVNFEFNNNNEDYSDLNNYAQDGTPCVYVSGESEKLGVVNQCNMSMCKIFGYGRREDIMNKDIEMLMPSLYSVHHRDILNLSIQKSGDQISSRERQIFGKHFSGFIFPLWLQIKSLPSILSGRQYVATFKVEKTGINKNVAHLLLNNEKELQDISSSCMTMLGISLEYLHKKQVYYDLSSLMPQLFAANNQGFMNKAGQLINYYFPKMVEYTDSKKKEELADNADGGDLSIKQDDTTSQFEKGSQGDEHDYTNQDFSALNAKGQSDKSQNPYNDKGSPEEDPGDVKDSQKDEENDNLNQTYQYRAIGNLSHMMPYQCNLAEIYFELIQLHGGYHLRLESNGNDRGGQAQIVSVNKNIKQVAFQFSYNPIKKKFERELRDQENTNFDIDKYFLNLKAKKELCKQELNQEDLRLQKYSNMSYIAYINKQQRLFEKGLGEDDNDDDEEDEEEHSEQSEEDSNMNDELIQLKKKKAEAAKTAADDPKARTSTVQQNVAEALKPNSQGIDYNKILVAGEGFGREFFKGEVERLIKVLQDKQKAGEDVHTFIRNEGPRKGWEEDNNQRAGLFNDRSNQIQKLEEEEEEVVSKNEKDQDRDSDQLKANIKSKKAFSMAINDKTMPPAIKRLSFTAQIILLLLIALATAEYALLYKQFTDLKENYILVEQSHLRIAELQRVAFYARTMILMASGLLTTYAGFPTSDLFAAYIKSEFSNSLDLIYKIQNEINLSQLPVSADHDQLLNNKTVTLYFKQDQTSMKALQFSLTESILQISSTVFTISNMKLQDFSESNEDIFFLMYNSFNNFYIGLKASANYYVLELQDRSDEKDEVSLILYLLSIGALVICFIVLIPVVHSVNQSKDKVLQLFCEIDNTVIKILSVRCEKFINSLSAEEGNDDVESDEDMDADIQNLDEEDEYSLLSGGAKKVKKAKGRTKTDKTFFLKFLVVLLCIHAYYLQNFLLEKDAVEASRVLVEELNITAETEPFYWQVINTQRELIFNPQKPIMLQNSLNVVFSDIYKLFKFNNDLQESHLNHESYLDASYWEQFEDIMRKDLCQSIVYFKSYKECSTFISETLTQGLHVIQVRYFETLRNNLNLYQLFISMKNQAMINSMFNQLAYNETYVIQEYVVRVYMRELVKTLSDSIQGDFSFRTERKIALFIVFVIVILIGFIAFWIPFLNSLNFQIYKTKLMLMIIPLEVLMKIKNVAKVLQSQSFISTTKRSKKSGDEEASNNNK